jgi:hypothetical protein
MQANEQPVQPARRRFTRAALTASGVLLTVKSTPGMAAQVCTSPSGSLSNRFASHHAEVPNCQGRSPGYWKNHNWNGTGIDSSTALFSTYFPCPPKDAQTFALVRLYDILSHKDYDADNVGMHMAASLLNVRAGLTAVPTEAQLIKIWMDYRANNVYLPSPSNPNIVWNGADIVDYLKSAMG